MTTNQPLTPRGAQIAPATRLARMLRNTLDAARRDGQDHHISLSGGAHVVMRVRAGQIAMTIKREHTLVSPVEIKTFCRDACVPESAVRTPASAQGERDGYFYVSYRWPDPDGSPTEAPDVH